MHIAQPHGSQGKRVGTVTVREQKKRSPDEGRGRGAEVRENKTRQDKTIQGEKSVKSLSCALHSYRIQTLRIVARGAVASTSPTGTRISGSRHGKRTHSAQ